MYILQEENKGQTWHGRKIALVYTYIYMYSLDCYSESEVWLPLVTIGCTF